MYNVYLNLAIMLYSVDSTAQKYSIESLQTRDFQAWSDVKWRVCVCVDIAHLQNIVSGLLAMFNLAHQG